MPKGISYVQRTLKELRQQGRICAIVERFNAFIGPHGIRQDLFGIIDVLALDPVRGVVGIQVCGQDFMQHVRKITEERAQETKDWLETKVQCDGCGERVRATALEIWGWRKLLKKRGGKQRVWVPRI